MENYSLDSIGNIKLYQPIKGYRFSVDSIILADFVKLKRLKTVLDLGAGAGIIGIILAKKYSESKVTMLEIQPELAELAIKNIELNGLTGRIDVYCTDARTWEGKNFDLVVSNPPFRTPGTGKLSPEEDKAIARHEIALSIMDIANIGQRVLRHRGRLCMIHLPERLIDVVRIMSKANLEIKRLRFVHSKFSSDAKMVLIEAVKGGRASLKVEPPLFIYENDGEYTKEMRMIYQLI